MGFSAGRANVNSWRRKSKNFTAALLFGRKALILLLLSIQIPGVRTHIFPARIQRRIWIHESLHRLELRALCAAHVEPWGALRLPHRALCRRLHLQWLPASSEGNTSCAAHPGAKPFRKWGAPKDCAFTLRGLEDHRDYAFQISRGDRASRLRLVRTGEAVGTVVNYLHPQDDCYSFSGSALCSPSLLRLPDGALLASMDVFASAAPQNLTLIFRSEDDGRTWNYACELMPCFWGRLFFHRGAVYMLACSTEYGDLLIAAATTADAPSALPRRCCGARAG